MKASSFFPSFFVYVYVSESHIAMFQMCVVIVLFSSSLLKSVDDENVCLSQVAFFGYCDPRSLTNNINSIKIKVIPDLITNNVINSIKSKVIKAVN